MERVVVAEDLPDHDSDPKRADDAESREFDPGAPSDAAEEGIDISW
jgi:hypothetical protein